MKTVKTKLNSNVFSFNPSLLATHQRIMTVAKRAINLTKNLTCHRPVISASLPAVAILQVTLFTTGEYFPASAATQAKDRVFVKVFIAMDLCADEEALQAPNDNRSQQ